MIVLIPEGKRGIGWRGALSDVCLTVNGPVVLVAKVVNGREQSLSMSGLPFSRVYPRRDD